MVIPYDKTLNGVVYLYLPIALNPYNTLLYNSLFSPVRPGLELRLFYYFYWANNTNGFGLILIWIFGIARQKTMKKGGLL